MTTETQRTAQQTADTTVTATSIDGDVTWPTLAALIAEAPTDWSDETAIPVWDADDERIGSIDPDTGSYTPEPDTR